MTPSKNVPLGLIFLLLGEVCMVQFSDREQHRGSVSANVGETVTLTCFYQDGFATYILWYKQMLGDVPRLLSSSRVKSEENATFYHEFKSNPRFSSQHKEGMNHLKISNLRLSDSATYYCGRSFYMVEFTTRVTLHVKGSGPDPEMTAQKLVSESVQPGDSVTLNCTVHTEICDGKHSVLWFRRSGESHVQIVYIHDDQCKESRGYKSGNCERIFNAGSSTQSCTYNLSMINLTFSDAGTYYCAVTSCGEMLFGNGTTLGIEEADQIQILVFLSIIRTGVLLCCLLIISILYMTSKRQVAHGYS